MAAFMPAWRAFDDTHSVRVLSKRPFGGGSVALCVAPSLSGSMAGPQLALSMARRWVEQGRSVIVADGHIGRPSLHELLGVKNAAGLAELLLVGGDWESLTVPTDLVGLRVIPAGGHAAPSEPEAVRERLAELCAKVEEAGQTLALVVPLGSMVAEWAVEECRDIIVLSSKGERTLHFFSLDEDRIRARIGPAVSEVPEGAALPTPVAAPAPTLPEVEADAVPEAPAPQAPPEPEAASGPEPEAESAAEARRERKPESKPEPELPLWDASEGFLTPRDEEQPSERSRRGRAGPAAVEDKWAAYAAQLRAKSENGGGVRDGEIEPEAPPAEIPEPDVGTLLHRETDEAVAPEPAPAPKGRKGVPPGARPARYPAQPPPGPADSAPLRDVEEEEEARGIAPRDLPAQPLTPEELAIPEEEDLFVVEASERKSARRRRARARVVGIALVAVAGIAGGWIWTTLRNRPPLDVQGVTPPRATVEAPPSADVPEAGPEAVAEGTEAGAGETAPPVTGGTEATPAGETTADTPTRPDPRPTPVVGAAGVGEAGAAHQRFTWSLAALGSYRAAADMVVRLRQRAPGEAFAVAPIVADGRTLYRVLGGLATTRPALLATREAMARTAGLAPETPFPREAPMAYALGDYGQLAEARSRAEELWGAGVPTYVLSVRRDDGNQVFRVYAGAYASAAEAQPLLTLLRAAGVADPAFVERRGDVPR